jgi:hypothetical protein
MRFILIGVSTLRGRLKLKYCFYFSPKVCFIANYLIAAPFLSHSISSECYEILRNICLYLYFILYKKWSAVIQYLIFTFSIFFLRHTDQKNLLNTKYASAMNVLYMHMKSNFYIVHSRVQPLLINLSWNRKPFLFCLISQYLVTTVLRILINIHFSLLVRVH